VPIRQFAAVALVIALAAGCGGANASSTSSDASIPGVTLERATSHGHKQGAIDYGGKKPPSGGDHNPVPLTCGAYSEQPPDENAVHSLEHGAVWITYQPDLPADQVDLLKKKVDGVEYMLMSPYAGLRTKVSIQSWGHQLFVDSASDPRIEEFIKDLRLNPVTTPEYGASCTNPDFKASPAEPGTPHAGPTDSGQPASPTAATPTSG
jgi:hypothetical protein